MGEEAVDVSSPSQRLEGDDNPAFLGQVSQGMKLLGGQVRIRDGPGRSIGTHEDRRRLQALHHVEFVLEVP